MFKKVLVVILTLSLPVFGFDLDRVLALEATTTPVTFQDVTAAAGIDTSPHKTWGLAWADYDNDGWTDVFVSMHGEIPALYHNNGNGTFTDLVQSAGMAIWTDRHGCAWGDYNADKFLDFYCSSGAKSGTGSWPNQLFRNNTNGTFTDVAVELGVDDGPGRGRSVNWLDYNQDGRLDLYLGNYQREGYPSRLFMGAAGSFSDVSTQANVADNLDLRSSSWADYDNDGDQDLLVAAMTGLILHKNNGDGTFTANSANEANLISQKNVSAAWGDYDNDGDQDLFVSRMGQSKLYKNKGYGVFRNVTVSSGTGITKARLGQWVDYDNDGDLDLFVVRDYDGSVGQNSPDALFINNSDGTFTDVAQIAGVVGSTVGFGDSAAWADYNSDGFLDLLVTNGGAGNVTPGPTLLYRNNGNSNHWLELKLRGNTNNTYGYGAKVKIIIDGKAQFREVTDNVVQYGQNDQVIHFGLGGASVVDEVKVQWPGGFTQTLINLAGDQILTVNQP